MSVASFGNIFSHSAGYLFVSFMVSFAVKMLLSLIMSYLFILFLFPLLQETDRKGHCCYFCQREMFCLYFPLI